MWRPSRALVACCLCWVLNLGTGTTASRTIDTTGVVTDLYVDGDGYFVIRQPTTGETRLTRFGEFRLAVEGFLENPSGYRLQGAQLDGSTPGDLQITVTNSTTYSWVWFGTNGFMGQVIEHTTTNQLRSFTIDTNGTITMTLTNDEERPAGRILLRRPTTAHPLHPVGDADWLEPELEHDLPAGLFTPGTDGTGWIKTGGLELPEPMLKISRFDRDAAPLADSPAFRTGIQTHLGFHGPGFLEVRDPHSDRRYLTRCGAFRLDWDGWLVTPDGSCRVQGFTDSVLNPEELQSYGDIRIDAGMPPAMLVPAVDPAATFSSYSIDNRGVLSVRLSDGNQYLRGQLLIHRIEHPERLVPAGSQLYIASPQDPPRLESAADTECTTLKSGTLNLNQLTPEVLEFWRKQTRGQQGPVMYTGDPAMLAVAGNGFFVIRNPSTGLKLLTRWGMFSWSAAGYLEALDGSRVQGLTMNTTWSPGDPPLGFNIPGVIGDLQMPRDAQGNPPAQHSIDLDGLLSTLFADGTRSITRQVWLAPVPDATRLREVHRYHYELTDPALAVSGLVMSSPGALGLGLIQSGALEQVWHWESYVPKHVPARGKVLTPCRIIRRSWKLETSFDLQTWTAFAPVRPSDWNPNDWPDSANSPGYPYTFGHLTLVPGETMPNAAFYRLVTVPLE